MGFKDTAQEGGHEKAGREKENDEIREEMIRFKNRLIKKSENIVNKTFVQILESLGYDIELTYVKREE